MRKRIQLSVALHVALVAGCNVRSVGDEQSALDPGALDAQVQEVAIRHMMSDGPAPDEAVVCIEVGYSDGTRQAWERRDAEPGFLGRFAYEAEVVAPGSECELESPVGRMRHTPSGKRAVLYSVGAPTWPSPDSAELVGAWYRGSLHGSVCRYVLAREGGHWIVVQCGNRIES